MDILRAGGRAARERAAGIMDAVREATGITTTYREAG